MLLRRHLNFRTVFVPDLNVQLRGIPLFLTAIATASVVDRRPFSNPVSALPLTEEFEISLIKSRT